jgi:DNA-binding XRE family transcriptional regulator
MSSRSITNRKKLISRLQHNLSAIRKIAGWTTEQMGEKIGVSKQTISNLENEKNPMNFTQYIAIRSVLDYEVETNPENDVLPKVMHILLDSNDDEYEEYKDSVNLIAASAAGGATIGSLGTVLSTLVPIAGLAIPIVANCTIWLKEALRSK